MSPWRSTFKNVAGAMSFGLALLATPSSAEDIASVLVRSHEQRLATLPALGSGSASVDLLERDFGRLAAALGPAARGALAFRVVATGSLAETLRGDVIVVNVALADWPALARWFVLAHELCHVRENHWAERVALYQHHIAGEVVQAKTDAVAAELGAAASQQSHRHEHAADECAMNQMLDLGFAEDELLQAIMQFGNHRATPTHPAMGQRVAHLRAVVIGRGLASRQPTPENRL